MYLPPLTLVPYLIQWLPQIPMYIPKYFLYPLDRRRAESGLTGPFLGDVPGVNLGVSLLAKRSNAVKMRRQLSWDLNPPRITLSHTQMTTTQPKLRCWGVVISHGKGQLAGIAESPRLHRGAEMLWLTRNERQSGEDAFLMPLARRGWLRVSG